MGKKRKDNLTPNKVTVTNNQNSKSNLDSDNESIYIPEKYPNDDKYENFVENFQINTQDKVEAGPSIGPLTKQDKINKEKLNTFSRINEKCITCNCKFTTKTISFMCSICENCFCLSCTKLSRKEASEIKKLSLKWTCINCIENQNQTEQNGKLIRLEKENILFKEIIYEMNEKFEKLIQTMDELKSKVEILETINIASKLNTIDSNINQILENLHGKESAIQEKNKLYSNILKTPPKKVNNENLPVLIIKPKKHQTYQQTKNEVQEKINPISVMASVSGIKEIKNGGIIIKGKSKEDIEKIKILSEKNLNEKYSINISKLKLPRLVLIGPKKMYTDLELLKEMRALNYLDENDTISIKYTRKSKYSDRYIIYIETKGDTFRKLVDKDISLGWDRCKVREDLNIMICFKCCGYGHKKEDCKKKIKSAHFVLENTIIGNANKNFQNALTVLITISYIIKTMIISTKQIKMIVHYTN